MIQLNINKSQKTKLMIDSSILGRKRVEFWSKLLAIPPLSTFPRRTADLPWSPIFKLFQIGGGRMNRKIVRSREPCERIHKLNTLRFRVEMGFSTRCHISVERARNSIPMKDTNENIRCHIFLWTELDTLL